MTDMTDCSGNEIRNMTDMTDFPDDQLFGHDGYDGFSWKLFRHLTDMTDFPGSFSKEDMTHDGYDR
jgi:hypothetical protein